MIQQRAIRATLLDDLASRCPLLATELSPWWRNKGHSVHNIEFWRKKKPNKNVIGAQIGDDWLFDETDP